jgi:hypothetical protein
MADTVKVVDLGLGLTTAALLGYTAAAPHHIAWGNPGSMTPAADGDTALQAESSEEARTTGTDSQQTTSTTSDTYRVVGTITCLTSAKDIKEVGLFTLITSGVLFLRGTFSTISVGVGDSIQFTINVQYNQA